MGQLLSSQRTDGQQTGGELHSGTLREELFHQVKPARAFRNTLAARRCVRNAPADDYEQFLTEFADVLAQFIEHALTKHHALRIAVFLDAVYVKLTCNSYEPERPITPVLRTKLSTVLRVQMILVVVHAILETLRARRANFMRNASGLPKLACQNVPFCIWLGWSLHRAVKSAGRVMSRDRIVHENCTIISRCWGMLPKSTP